MKTVVQKTDLLYPELSFKIVGALFDIYNQLGHGLSEQTYQRAAAVALKDLGLKFSEQIYFPITFKGVKIARQYFDFLVEDKIVVEIKKGDKFAKSHIDQLYQYLVSSKLKLGLLVYFTPNKVHYKRIVNLDS